MTDEVTLDSALDCLLTYLPIEMEGSYTLKDLFEVLLRAASVEHRVRALEGALSGNRIRYHLDKLEDMAMR